MKLKQILDEKTIEFIVNDEQEVFDNFINEFDFVIDYLKENDIDSLKEDYPISESQWRKIKPYFEYVMFKQVMGCLQSENKKAYDELYNLIIKEKGEVEINFNELGKDIPFIREINKDILIYKTNDAYKKP